MKKICMTVSAALLILGCLTLGLSLLLLVVLPKVFHIYLTANPVSFSHEILSLDMTAPVVFSAVEIIAGIAGMLYFGHEQ